ncbi:hypothetical protein PTTG_00156 [Puccinia triticina 1-1 BBBD Race 1]|uniref:Retrotransposon gag domain-containing protein n=1 Tax=Puccinia triticina (isolate 1-1 / race 1 (BBBD)) TaxID=630390 RepID=A0A0C4EHE0_PUCT1|nr:hypothetical protein PTTG_00156 [Puccinia triticina 1-1 BBBD Race 1]
MNQFNQQSSSGNPLAPEEMSNNNLIQAILVLQQNTAKQLLAAQAQAKLKAVQSQARANVKAALDAWSKNVNPKTESTPAPQLAPGRNNLQRFKILDGPYFKGPFQGVKAFLCWIQALQIFFATKLVTHADNKRLIVGGLISETNLPLFYSNKFSKYKGKSWEDFKEQMFEFSLPVKWKTALKRNIAQMKMADTETFLEFSTCGRTLQSLVNFDKHLLDDYELAEAVTFGLPEFLQAKIDDHQTLRLANFKYGKFKNCTSGFYSNLHKSPALRLRRNASTTTATSRMADTVWRLHSYLDSVGLCHFCKRHCGSAPKACLNPMDKSWVDIPASFVPPLKPADYAPPVAWTAKNSGPTKTNPATAGRPIGRPAGVAGLTNKAPDLDKLKHSGSNYSGRPNAIKMLSSSAATRDDKFVPEVPQFNQASFLKACGAIAKGGSAKSEGTITPTDAEDMITPADPGMANPQTNLEATVLNALTERN